MTPPEDVRLRELSLKEQELKLRETELQQQILLREAELRQQAQDREAERELERVRLQQQSLERQAEIELRKAEIRLQEQHVNEDIELRRAEATRMRNRDEQMAERERSLVAQTKRFGDVMKHVLPRMPVDPGELMNFWDTCDNLWNLYEVPEELRAKLLLPLLTPKAKSLISRLDATALADVKQIKAFLLNEFRLTSREYRARFNAAVRGDETHVLFTSRLKNLWGLRKCWICSCVVVNAMILIN